MTYQVRLQNWVIVCNIYVAMHLLNRRLDRHCLPQCVFVKERKRRLPRR